LSQEEGTAVAIFHVLVHLLVHAAVPLQPHGPSPRRWWDTVPARWEGGLQCPVFRVKTAMASQSRGVQPALTLFKIQCNLGAFSLKNMEVLFPTSLTCTR